VQKHYSMTFINDGCHTSVVEGNAVAGP